MKQDEFKRRLKAIRKADRRQLRCCRIELSAKFVRDFPDRGRAWFELGIALYPLARYEEALLALRRGLRLCPPRNRHVVQSHFGHLYRQKGEYRRAEAWYRKALMGRPKDAGGYIFLGALLATSGRLKEAEAVHRKATRCREGCIDEAYLNLGLVLRAQQHYRKARACFVKALELSPKYPEARRRLTDMDQVLILTGKSAKTKRAVVK